MIRSIAVVGPESSGKTTIVEDLAQWLRGAGLAVSVVAEQGRLLAEQLPAGHAWSHREQTTTSLMHRAARGVAHTVMAAADPSGVVLCDGTCVTPLVWHMCAVRRRPGYDAGPPEVTENLVADFEAEVYDLVLLAAPDLPWEPDGVRDDPAGRQEAFDLYRDLIPEAVPVCGPRRIETARRRVSALLRIPSDSP